MIEATTHRRIDLSGLAAPLSEIPIGYPPSTYAVDDLVEGRPGGLGRVLILTAMRAAFVAPGLYLAGQRKDMIKTSLFVSGTITLGMIGVKLWTKRSPGT